MNFAERFKNVALIDMVFAATFSILGVFFGTLAVLGVFSG